MKTTDLKNIKHILVSRTDSIGDVVLTLPMAGILKEILPGVKISFLGRKYTMPVIALSKYVDEAMDFDALRKMQTDEQIEFLKSRKIDCVIHVFPNEKVSMLCKKARIPVRAGTKNRLYHWFHCNKLIKLSRKKSELHEAQLNLKLIQFLGAKDSYSLDEVKNYYGFEKFAELDDKFEMMIDPTRENVILHPKSKGSAREWGLENFDMLIKQMPAHQFKIFISGSREEGVLCKPLIENNPQVIDLTGKMNLEQFIAFIYRADGLIAASTGPLHIAAALGKKALGLFAPMRPIHPGRWMPVGKRASFLVLDKECSDCKNGGGCSCIKSLAVGDVLRRYNEL